MLFCSALKYRNILTNRICLLCVAQLCESEIIHHSVRHWGWTSLFALLMETRLVLHFPAFSDDICSALHGQCTDNGASVWKRFEASASWLFSAAVQRCLLPTAAASFFFSSLLQYDLGPKLHPVIPHYVEENEENCIHLMLTLTLCTQRLCVAVLSILECVCIIWKDSR